MSKKPILIFGGVDGTSIEEDANYEVVFRDSNVHRTFLNWSHGPKAYRRGPNVLDNRADISTAESARAMRDHVVAHWGSDPSGKAVFLAGYSRGGAAVIETCKFLKELNIPVECLILFDPVDRSRGVGGIFSDTPICDNVQNVIHIIRSPAAMSRESFGNCGTKRESWVKTKGPTPVAFLGTHAAMGGTLWPDPGTGKVIDEGFPDPPDGPTAVTYTMDVMAFGQVRNYFQAELRKVLDACLARMAKEGKNVPDFQVTPVSGGSLPPTGQVKRYYIVKPGDWLSKIAQQYYGDPMKYDVIHRANLSVIGPNPDLIKPNQRLEIPYI